MYTGWAAWGQTPISRDEITSGQGRWVAGRRRDRVEPGGSAGRKHCLSHDKKGRPGPAGTPFSRPRTPSRRVLTARQLVPEGRAAAADRGANQGALLAADGRADPGAGTRRRPDDDRALGHRARLARPAARRRPPGWCGPAAPRVVLTGTTCASPRSLVDRLPRSLRRGARYATGWRRRDCWQRAGATGRHVGRGHAFDLRHRHAVHDGRTDQRALLRFAVHHHRRARPGWPAVAAPGRSLPAVRCCKRRRTPASTTRTLHQPRASIVS